MEALFNDLTHSIRMLRQRPGFTTTMVAVLALGIGATVSFFSIVNAVLLKPLPYPDPDRIVVFTTGTSGSSGPSSASPVKFNVWRELTSVFQDISAYRYSRLNLTGVDHPEQVRAALVSSGYFRLLGQVPAVGRTFTSEEDVPTSGGVAVLSEAFWRRAFGGDPRMIGRTISLAGKPHEVIGIMASDSRTESPPSFDGTNSRNPIDVWIPLQIDPNSSDENGYLSAAARLRPGIALETASARLRQVTEEYRRRFPSADLPQNFVFAVKPMRAEVVGEGPSFLWTLLGAVGLVLLIACTNVANLLLMRATGRQREIAIRTALGADRRRIVRQLLTESAVLSVIGGVFGIVLGWAGVRAVLSLNIVRYSRIGDDGAGVTVDWRVLLFAIFVSLGTGVLFGLVPALQGSRVDLNEALKQGGGRSDGGFRQNKIRSLLVVSEVTLAMVLLVGSGLLVRTIIALRSVNPGFDARHVLTMRISLTSPRFQKAAGVAELVRDSIQRIRALPGVQSAASTCCLPLEDRNVGGVIIAGRPLSGGSHGAVNISTISPGYFDVLRIPIVRGRAIAEREVGGHVVVISEAMVRRFWREGDPLGDALKESLVFPDLPGLRWQIIGVAGDVRADGLGGAPPPIVYFPLEQTPEALNTYTVRSPMAWIVRTSGESYSLTSAVQKELSDASGGLPVSNIRSMDSVRTGSFAGRQFNMLLLTIFAGSALLLAAIGIYGVMAFSVQQRSREIAVRVAIGAAPGDVRNMVVFQGVRLALIGQGVGLVVALGLLRFIAALLFGVEPHDTVVFVSVFVILTGVAFMASWLPAHRASRVDPIEALRAE